MKKFLSVFLIAIVLLSIASFNVSAESVFVNDYSDTEGAANGTDTNYYAHCLVAQRLVEKTNAKIEAMVEEAIAETNPDLDKLVAETSELAQKTIDKAANWGVEVVCEYKAYEINGVVVYIDPLIVIKR